MTVLKIDVVSIEEKIFSGQAKFVVLPGESGELGILPFHTPLITRIRPGIVRIEMEIGNKEFIFVSGGILEVQPKTVTILADTAIRGKDIDFKKAEEAKKRAEKTLQNAKSDIDLAKAQLELASLIEQLKIFKNFTKLNKKY